jgi:hypothetical protein
VRAGSGITVTTNADGSVTFAAASGSGDITAVVAGTGLAGGGTSGSVTINDTVIHAGISSLPLGGIGASGVGRYHGQAGFDSFSYERSYFYQSRLNITNMMRPPYKETADRILSWLLR